MPIHIVADTKESRSGIAKRLQSVDGVEVVVRDLDMGDYQVSDDCVIERKTASDFVLSLLDGRLLSQSLLMKANVAQPVMIIEGDLYANRYNNFSQASLQGALSALSVLHGFTIIPSQNEADTAGLVATMARLLQQGLGYEIPLRVKKPKDVKVLQQYIIEGLPAAGGKRAQDILSYFGTVASVFNASVDEMSKVPGVGKGTAQKIYDIIHAKYK